MANIRFVTINNANPRGKPRVLFTCHPKDFNQYFERICKSIFRTHDCAIFYTEDMSEPIPKQDQDTILGSNNLLVIPVTRKLLTQPNRAMDDDVPYALRVNIPILPIMVEPFLDKQYSRPNKFGKLQYLSLCVEDASAISFEDKLRKYLDTVLISNEIAQRIRAAFDAYIFLSYRKKDRSYANELMRMIHRNSQCRDIAIWYDEFLTPGESFKDNIDKFLRNSKLFTLLVTPNLLEEPGGNPNYVMAEEYPTAKASGIKIMPAEMVPTDKVALSKKYQDIPQCVPTNDDVAFQKALTATIQKIAVTTNDTDPEHTFLIGLAYLEGIDVEVDRDRGIELITKAADSPLPEAMKMLSQTYSSCSGKNENRYKAVNWAERYWEYHTQTYGEKHPSTLAAMFFTVQILGAVHFDDEAVILCQKVYALQCEILGKDHYDTLESLIFWADMLHARFQPENALELYERAYAGLCKTLGEADPKTISTIHRLADVHCHLHNCPKASALYEKAYSLTVAHWGLKSYEANEALLKAAMSNRSMGNYQTALKLCDRLYTIQGSDANRENTFALDSLYCMAEVYDILNDRAKVLRIRRKIYAHQRKALKKGDPKILKSLEELIKAYEGTERFTATSHIMNNMERVENFAPVKLYEEAYALRRRTDGKTGFLTLRSMDKLAAAYEARGRHRDAVKLHKKAYAHHCEVYGEESDSVYHYLNELSFFYREYGYENASQKLKEKADALHDILNAKQNARLTERKKYFATSTNTAVAKRKAVPDDGYNSEPTCEAWNRWHAEIQNEYHIRSKYVGDTDGKTISILRELAWSYVSDRNLQKALELYEIIVHIHEEMGNHQGALYVKNLIDSLQWRPVSEKEKISPDGRIYLFPYGDREYRTAIPQEPPENNKVYLIPCGDRSYQAVISQDPPENTAIFLTEEGQYPANVSWRRVNAYLEVFEEEEICEDGMDLVALLNSLGRAGYTIEYVDFLGADDEAEDMHPLNVSCFSSAPLVSFSTDSERFEFMDYLRIGNYTFAELNLYFEESLPTVHLIVFNADCHLIACLDHLRKGGHMVTIGDVLYAVSYTHLTLPTKA